MNRTQTLILRTQSFLSWIFCCLIELPLLALLINTLFSYKVYNRQYLKELKPPFIVASNHLTLLDSWFGGYAVTFPSFYFKSRLLLWHLPEKKNYYRWFIAPFIWLSKTIPITRKGTPREQKTAMEKITSVLQNGEAIYIFLEGTRSRTGRMEHFTTGIGKIWQKIPNCTILPIYLRGTENVLPVGGKFPNFFKKIDVVIGKPVKLSTADKGLTAMMDISKQAFNLLVEMEKDYFESGKYRANEILK